MKYSYLKGMLPILAIVALAMWPTSEAEATCSTQDISFSGTHIIYTNDCTDDNEVLVETGDMTNYDACFVMSTTGVVDIFVSLDGTTYATAALSMTDNGATTTDRVLVTVALRVYGFVSKFRRIRVLQNGATDAAASLLCWNY